MAATHKTCPKCGKTFKGPGLNGHLRFTHRLGEAQVNELAAQAKTAATPALQEARPTNPAYRLMDELVEIQRRRAELKPMTSPILSGSNPTIDKALSLLDAMEEEISTKLDELKRQKVFSPTSS